MVKRSSSPKPIIISPQAQDDLIKVTDYVSSKWGLPAVENFFKKLHGFYKVVSTHPNVFRFYSKRKNIRKFALNKHVVIYYRNTKLSVDIVAVFDSRQNPILLKQALRKRNTS